MHCPPSILESAPDVLVAWVPIYFVIVGAANNEKTSMKASCDAVVSKWEVCKCADWMFMDLFLCHMVCFPPRYWDIRRLFHRFSSNHSASHWTRSVLWSCHCNCISLEIHLVNGGEKHSSSGFMFQLGFSCPSLLSGWAGNQLTNQRSPAPWTQNKPIKKSLPQWLELVRLQICTFWGTDLVTQTLKQLSVIKKWLWWVTDSVLRIKSAFTSCKSHTGSLFLFPFGWEKEQLLQSLICDSISNDFRLQAANNLNNPNDCLQSRIVESLISLFV